MRTVLMTVGLLIASNTFMTIAWYGHLKHRDKPLLIAIIVSWLIALFEYMLQVPANRIGYGRLSLTQLKVIQECITLSVFLIYAAVIFREQIQWNTIVSMVLIVAAVFFAFMNGLGKQ